MANIKDNLLLNKSGHSYANVHAKEVGDDELTHNKQSFNVSALKSKIYQQYGYRWVVLNCFFAAILLNGLAYETCIPNAKQFIKIYGVSGQVITLTATIYLLMHPLFTFAASSVIIKKGFAYSVNIGCMATILGFAVRLLVNKSSFYFVLLGQILCGIGRPFILNSQATMAQNWFFPSNRTAILTGCNMIQTVSFVISMTMPANMIFRTFEYDTDIDPQGNGEELSFDLMLYQFLMSLLLVPCIFLIKSNADTPPSGFANTDTNIAMGQAAKKMFADKNFVLILIAFSVYFGSLKGFGLILPYLMSPFGFIDAEYSIAGSMVIVGGLISSSGISKIVLKYKKYKIIVVVLMILSIISLTLFDGSLYTYSVVTVYAVCTLIGFFLVPMAPVMLEYSCEAIYPLSGSFAVGLLLSGATLLTVGCSQMLTEIVKGENSDKQSVVVTTVVQFAIFIFGLVVFLFTKEILNRSKEINQRSQSKASVFFKASKLKQSIEDCNFKDDVGVKQAVGDFPTEHPFVDPHQFIEHPEVLDPDVIMTLQNDQDN